MVWRSASTTPSYDVLPEPPRAATAALGTAGGGSAGAATGGLAEADAAAAATITTACRLRRARRADGTAVLRQAGSTMRAGSAGAADSSGASAPFTRST